MQFTPLLLTISYLIVNWYNTQVAYPNKQLRYSSMLAALVMSLIVFPLLTWSDNFKLLFCVLLMTNTLAVLWPNVMATKNGQYWLKFVNGFTYLVIPIAFIFYLIE